MLCAVEQHACGGAETHTHETGCALVLADLNDPVCVALECLCRADFDACAALVADIDVRIRCFVFHFDP